MDGSCLGSIGFVGRSKANGWIGGVRISFISQEHVKIGQSASGQEEGVVGGAVIDGGQPIDT